MFPVEKEAREDFIKTALMYSQKTGRNVVF